MVIAHDFEVTVFWVEPTVNDLFDFNQYFLYRETPRSLLASIS
jgi:hypothetical protein